jgi:hypothetical protein
MRGRHLAACAVFIAFSASSVAHAGSSNAGPAGTGAKASSVSILASEVALMRYHSALKLTAAQEKLWPSAVAALRSLARMAKVDEAAVRRVVPAVQPLLVTLDDTQIEVAMRLAKQAGLAQYASLF